MAKKSKIESVLETKIADVRFEMGRLGAVLEALTETLRLVQGAKSTPKRNRTSTIRQAVVNTFNDTASKAVTGKPT